MTVESLYLVRTGSHENDTLTDQGRQEAESAKDKLIASGLGSSALVLSSTAQRTMQTAGIIAEGLKAMMLPSKRMMIGGREPEAIRNFDNWIDKAIQEADPPDIEDQQLVVVTHAPLITVAEGFRLDEGQRDLINFGEVVKYEAGTWRNPSFKDYFEINAEHELSS